MICSIQILGFLNICRRHSVISDCRPPATLLRSVARAAFCLRFLGQLQPGSRHGTFSRAFAALCFDSVLLAYPSGHPRSVGGMAFGANSARIRASSGLPVVAVGGLARGFGTTLSLVEGGSRKLSSAGDDLRWWNRYQCSRSPGIDGLRCFRGLFRCAVRRAGSACRSPHLSPVSGKRLASHVRRAVLPSRRNQWTSSAGARTRYSERCYHRPGNKL